MILFAQSHFSLLQSTLTPETICQAAIANTYDTICLVDENNLYATPAMLRLTKEYNLKILHAATLKTQNDALSAIATSPHGFQNLCHLISNIHKDKNFCLRHNINLLNDLVFFTETAASAEFLLQMKLPCYWALHIPNKIPPLNIQNLNIPVLAVHTANLLNPCEHNTRALMHAIQKNELFTKNTQTVSRPIYHLEQYRQAFNPYPEALLSQQQLQASIHYYYKPNLIFPDYQTNTSYTPFEQLKQLTYTGATKRYPQLTDEIKKRINYELSIIHDKNFDCYFLIVHEIVSKATRTCGRGSGSGSVVSYCLFITNIDPIRYHLLFERFLSPDRIDYPDLDIDFAWDERDGILDYIKQRFGADHCAMVSNHISFKPKMALRETAKAHGYSALEIRSLSRKIREILRKDKTALSKLDSKALQTAKHALALIKHPRHISLHCGGIVITPQPVYLYAPVETCSKDMQLLQWEKDGTEEMGLVKIDLLGNRSLAVIRDAIANCKDNGNGVDFHQFDPAQDPLTIQMLETGNSMGVFYIESPATRLLHKRSKKGDFEHSVIHSSIIRPASNKSINEYLRRVHGGTWVPITPRYEEITSDAYGLMVYEDHILQVAHELAGFTYLQANKLRKALSRDDADQLQKLKNQFYEGLLQHELATINS